MADSEITRRALLGGTAAPGMAGVARFAAGRSTDDRSRLLDVALAADTGASSLDDVRHVVVLMQENRSFDHYFGTLSGTRGFADPAGQALLSQAGFQPGTGPGPAGVLQPFHLLSDPPLDDNQTTNDISHSWSTQHQSWHDGATDARSSPPTWPPTATTTARSPWATSPARTWRSTTRWPTPSPSATAISALCWAPPNRTG